MTKTLEQKIALVTGGSRGIGAAIVQSLAAAGATVYFTYSKSSGHAQQVVDQVTAAGGQAVAVQADAAHPDHMAALVDQVVARAGRIDILVNNAGVFLIGPLGDFSLEQYQTMMNVNVNSVYTLTHHAVRYIPKGGRIINIASVLGERASGPGMAAYTASKAAVCGLTRGWAFDLGPKNITVNAVLPGPINTDMNPVNGPYAAMQIKKTALGRYGEPTDVAAMVAFLASPAAQNITGATLAVDGGWNA